MDETALQTWIEESLNFDNLMDQGPFGNTNNLDYRLTWSGYAHEGFYEAVFTDHYLRALSAGVTNGIPLDLALDCFGQPEAYLSYIEYSSTGSDAFLFQLWFPEQGIVLSHINIEDYDGLFQPEINGQLRIDSINFVQPGSIEDITERAFLLDSSWLFPNWAELIKPWPGTPQEIHVIEITRE
jgi:hypothetical protein